jgi:hypothetical protein
VPLPKDPGALKELAPLIIKHHYDIDYIHSYAQDSPFFAGLANQRLLGTRCQRCNYTYATPRAHCMECGQQCDWVDLPQEGRIHTFTVCHYGSEEFLKDTLFLSRVVGLDPQASSLGWIGMPVKAKFRRLATFRPTDVYFVPIGTSAP